MFGNQVGSILARVNRIAGRVRDRATRDAFVNMAAEFSRTFGNPMSKLVHRGPVILIPPPNGRTLQVGGEMVVERIIDRNTNMQMNDFGNLVNVPTPRVVNLIKIRGVLQGDLVRDGVSTLVTVGGPEVLIGGYFVKVDHKIPDGLRVGATVYDNGDGTISFQADVTDDCLVHV